MTRRLVLLLVVFAERRQPDVEVIHLISARKAVDYEEASTTTNSRKRLKISEKTREAYRKRDRALDRDPDAPQLPPDYWASAAIGKYYRPLKTQISFRSTMRCWIGSNRRAKDT
jgi:hypothetical protein